MQKLLNSLAMNPNSSNHMLPITRNELISNNETGRFFPGSQISRQQRVVKQELLASNHHEVKEEEEEEENDFYDEDEHDESLEVDVDMMDEAEIDDELEDHHNSLIESSNSHSELFNNTTANSSGSSSTMAPAPNFVRQTTRKGAGQNFKRQESLGDEKQEAKFCGSSTPRSSTSSVAIPTLKGNKNSGNAKAKGTSWLDTQPKLNSKSKSGYILFSAEVRKRVMNENPSAGFGEVSRMVGIEWKRLSNEQKRQYETRAQFIAEERAKAELLTPTSKMPQPGQIRVYCCRWQQCDYQFDSQDGLYAHIRISHTSQLLENDNQYACLWNSCIKYRKDGKPFPTLPRLHRHIKEKHMPTTIRLMFPNQRAKNYFVHSPPAKPHLSNGGTHHTSKSMQTEDYGRFVHHPYGDVPNNPVSCPVPTPIFPGSNNQLLSGPSTSEQQQQGLRHHMTIGQPQQQISQPQQQPMVAPSSTPIRYMSSAQPTMTTPKSSYGGGQSSLLNGTLISQQQSSTSNNSTHYVIQQRQVPQQQQQIHQQQSGIQQQTVFIPAGQQAIVVNGTTVYIPANAQTIILPPGYTGPQQHQQIVVHTTQPPQQQQQMVQPHLHSKQQQQTQQYQQSYNSTTIAAAASTPGHSQNLSVSAHSQQQHHSHEVFAQSSSAAIGVAQRHHQVNGMPTTQSASTSHAQSASIHVASSSSSVPVNSSTTLGALLHQNFHPQHASSLSQQQQQPSTSAAIYQSTSQIEQQQSQIGPDVQQITDPGRTIVNAPKLTEPIFLSPSNAINVKRVVHSEAYLKYIESMFNAGAKQRIVSKWDKSLLASHRNTVVPNHRKLPYDWIRRSANGSKPKEEGIVRALWKLRDQLVEGTTAINRNTLGNPVEAEAPHP